jgi:hypothetical protein
VGGSNCKPRGIPTLATRAQRKWKGRSAAEVCTSETRKTGEWLAGARGYLPLAALAVDFALAFQQIRAGVAGRTQARRGGSWKTRNAAEMREERSSLNQSEIRALSSLATPVQAYESYSVGNSTPAALGKFNTYYLECISYEKKSQIPNDSHPYIIGFIVK